MTINNKKTDHLDQVEQRSEEIGPEQLATRPGKEVSMTTQPIFDDGPTGCAARWR